jgi:SOS-response transcriptional repressor LexA
MPPRAPVSLAIVHSASGRRPQAPSAPRLSLTRQQFKAKTFIQGYIAEHGVGPSYDEVMVALGLSSKSGVSRIVNGLADRGHVIWNSRMARSLRVVEHSCPNCGCALDASPILPAAENGASS